MINSANIMGRICNDLEMRSTTAGTSVINFTLAVDRQYVAQGKQREADFVDMVAWGKAAEFLSLYFRKGSLVAVTGRIQTRTYEDKNGVKRKVTEVVADHVSFCGEKNERNDQPREYRYDEVDEVPQNYTSYETQDDPAAFDTLDDYDIY